MSEWLEATLGPNGWVIAYPIGAGVGVVLGNAFAVWQNKRARRFRRRP